MNNPNNRLKELLQKYVDKTISYEEHTELFGYISDEQTKDDVLAFMDQHQKTVVSDIDVHETDWDSMYTNITSESRHTRFGFLNKWNLAIAAMLVIVGGYTIFQLASRMRTEKHEFVYKNDVLPGGDKAILTLSNGSTIALTGHSNGKLATQEGITIEKDEAGQIVYHATNDHIDGAGDMEDTKYNTVTTPAGGTFKVVLGDGSKVWLNAGSSLRFPITFSKNQRKVEVTGEAYFEIEKDKNRPFFVLNGNSEVKVLGTHFNVMSYQDELQSEVTLLEGAIQFTKQNKSQLLKPGMQVVYNRGSAETKQVVANVEEVMAWRNGLFVFNNTGIDKIMKDLSRWYNVDVTFEGDRPDIAFTGVIPRNANVSKVLKVLEATGDVKFGIDGHTVVCSKKKK